MSDFRGYNPAQDPARRKSAALRGAPGTGNYPQNVATFNNWLYTPMDLRPTPPAAPALSDASAPGFHGPTSPVAPGSYSSKYGSVSMSNPSYVPPAPAYGGVPMAGGLAGPNGPALSTETAPRAVMPADDSASMSAPTPPQNAMQRWSQPQQEGGLRPISDQRRYFWATGHIDARAPQADPTTNKGATPSPTFNNEVPGHSNWQPGQAGFTFNAGGGHSQWSPW